MALKISIPPSDGKEKLHPKEKLHQTIKRISEVAIDLNAASDELNIPIRAIETALKKLNLGVPAWVTLSSGGNNKRHGLLSHLELHSHRKCASQGQDCRTMFGGWVSDA